MTGPRTAVLALACLCASACGAARPFSVTTPGLQRLQQENTYLYAEAPGAMQALGSASLGDRVQNLIDTYEEELVRAEAAQGGFLNTTLNILGILLPVSGTASAIALSDPDDAKTVGIVAGAATTATMALNLLLKPGAKAAAASECAGFLGSALTAIRLQWDESRLGSLEGTQEEWDSYLTMRGTLEPARSTACEG
ncbi:MAG: hypothetical protein OEN56_14460 [Gemmatimonadota bacterium]|nr:hypothetical protein [Gemmatimonadota bacterium]